ncbi:MAG: hypothetical protein IIZ39_03975 [Blautia sp.]|nr:hypothetical protein [Blautia sp.]
MFVMEVAGLLVRVFPQFSFVETYCRDYEVRKALTDTNLTIHLSLEEAKERRERSLGLGRREYPLWYYEAEALFRRLALCLPSFDAMFIHSALLSVQGAGIALAAPTGGGKTVQLKLWQKAFPGQVHVINGDKPIYRRVGDDIVGFGSPWRGKEAMGEGGSVSLSAMFFLEKGKEAALRKLSPSDVMEEILYYTELPSLGEEEAVAKVLSAFLMRVPIYKLTCTMGQETVDLAWEEVQRLFMAR